MTFLLADICAAARSLRRTPAFTLAAVLTLALGVGATAGIFSVAHAVVFKPLPYADPARRVMIWSQWKGWDKTWVSEAELFDYRSKCRTLAAVAAWDSGQINVTGSGEPVRVGIGHVTANTFRTLGVNPALGRGFSEQEDQPGRNSVVVLSRGLWERLYGGDARVIGRSISLDGIPHTVVGVMPRDFHLPTDFTEDAAQPTELWVPLAINPSEIERGSHGLYAAALLVPNATATQATAELRSLGAALTKEGLYPADMQFRAFAIPLEEEILGRVRPAFLLLLGAVGFLLLIACANVASLMLARAESRHRDVAVRAALGASRGRLVRYVLTESLVLATAGASVGLGLAWAASRAAAAAGPINVPRVGAVSLDASVLAFTALLALATTVAFGIAPVLGALRVAPAESLGHQGTRTTAGGPGRRVRSLLVVAEMTLAVVMVIGAGLMVRSLQALHRIDLGFNPENVLTARLWLPASSYPTPEKVVAFYEAFLARVRALPGVKSAGLVRSLPLGGTIGDWGLDIEGQATTAHNRPKGDWQVATDGAFEALGERLVRGRFLDARDATDALQVAVINETMARTYWPQQDPIGHRIRLGRGRTDRPWVTVVGVVGDERHNGITAVVKEKFYRPLSQFHVSTGNAVRGMTLVLRTGGDPLSLGPAIREALREQDPTLPLAGVRPMTEVVEASTATPRVTGILLGCFAMLALALAAVGIYGVLSYLVTLRTREIGIRMAVGANRGQVMWLVLSQGLGLAAAGIALGVAGAAALTRFMVSLLHDVRPLDAVTFALVPVLLIAVGAAAAYMPARRATRVDPIVALRTE